MPTILAVYASKESSEQIYFRPGPVHAPDCNKGLHQKEIYTANFASCHDCARDGASIGALIEHALLAQT